MRRLLAILACAGLAAAACGGVGAAVAAAAKHRAPVHLMIEAQEWSLWPSRSRLPAGTVLVELWNRGQDMHDAWIRRLNAAGQMVGPVLGRVRVTRPGQISQATWRLKAGRYELFCSMPGHMDLGMHAKLTVTRA
jgi:plastocyanin